MRLRTGVLIAVVGCLPNFRLQERDFVAEGEGEAESESESESEAEAESESESESEAEGEICGNRRDDDDNGAVDCNDPACGLASCDDENLCTNDACLSSGSCATTANENACGTGCQCGQGEKHETLCLDTLDNDGDKLTDCHDDDCEKCPKGTLCCDSGRCLPSCF